MTDAQAFRGFRFPAEVVLWAVRWTCGSRSATATFHAVLAVMGLVPGLDTTFGLVPIYGHDVWLHALLAGVAAYFGFVAAPEAGDRTSGAGTVPRS